MKNNIPPVTVNIKIDDQTFELSINDARFLYDQLGELLGEKNNAPTPSYPSYPTYPSHPMYPTYPYTTCNTFKY